MFSPVLRNATTHGNMNLDEKKTIPKLNTKEENVLHEKGKMCVSWRLMIKLKYCTVIRS